MKYRRIATILLVILIIVTTYLMLTPRPPRIEKDIPNIDKIEHAAAFLVLSFLLAYSISERQSGRIRKLFTVVAILSLYGILIEILQKYTGRNPEIADIVFDIGGALLGGGLSIFFCD